MSDKIYDRAIDLLREVSTPSGFLASNNDGSNYNRVWARDGVICGLAALASEDEKLIETFARTLETLHNNQHEIGTVPSNVSTSPSSSAVSYGGLAGRVDAVTWYIIGVCHLSMYCENGNQLYFQYQGSIDKALALMNAWEFNNADLMYTPLSGNWADEYITDGYVLYDQLLRIWALKLCNKINPKSDLEAKLNRIIEKVLSNFSPQSAGERVHPRAFDKIKELEYLPASFSPSGYKTNFDALAHSIFLLLDLGDSSQNKSILTHAEGIRRKVPLKILPAFWPVIKPSDPEWYLLEDNCKYEFRNYPYEFHNGGSWPMVNGFYGMALIGKGKLLEAHDLMNQINTLNQVEDRSFYENFNSKTGTPNGVAKCAWSAAATVMLHQAIYNNFKLSL